MSIHQRYSVLVGAFVLGCTLLVPRSSSAQPAHLLLAEELASNVTPALNEYGSNPSYVIWADDNPDMIYANRSVCTTFVTAVFAKAYGITSAGMKAWFGSTSPNATMYHDAIVAENGFDLVPTIFDVEPGDFLAVRYPAGGSVSGHLATITSEPVLRVSTPPIVAGTFQYEVEVIDSSSTGHGPTDTRNLPGGGWDAGAGIGVMRVYVDALGNITGHTWSTNVGIHYGQATRHMVIGRLQQ